jgi:hypothetical protein
MAYNSPVNAPFEAYPYPNTTKQLFDVLGFTVLNSNPADGGNGGYTLAQSIRYVDIVSPQLTYNQALKDTMSQAVTRDVLCRLYINSAPTAQSTVLPWDPTLNAGAGATNPLFVPPGCAPTVLYLDFPNPKQIQWIPNQGIPGYLQFQVYDDNGSLLDENLGILSSITNFGASLDWSMSMLVSEN